MTKKCTEIIKNCIKTLVTPTNKKKNNMGLEDLVRQQDENAVRIQKAVANIKKARLERRTLEFYQAKSKELEALWDKFNKLDTSIRQWHGDEVSHQYFSKDIYRAVGAIYSEARDDIEMQLKQIASTTAPSPDLENPEPTTSRAAMAAHATSVPEKPKVSMPAQARAVPEIPEATATKAVLAPSDLGRSITAARIQKQQKIIQVVTRSLRQLLSDTTPQPPQYYSTHAKSIGHHWQAAQDLHKVIWESLDNIDENSYDFDAYVQIEVDVNNDLLRLQNLAQLRPPAASSSRQHSAEEVPTMKLPRIELPKFDGNFLKWRQFHDLFVELINNQPISACQKMWYLQSSLTGEAGNLIKHLTTSASNYDAAWKIINDRYENTRCLVYTTIAKLMSQPAATSESASSIKALHDTTQECILSLQNLGVNTDNWDSILIYTLVQLLSKATHALWEQSLTEPKNLPTIDQFLKFLNFRFQSLEALGPKMTKGNLEQSRNGSYRALSAAVTSKANCMVCNHSHALFTCQKFLAMTPSQRLNCVQKARHCVNCLRDGHKAKDCTSGTCNTCNKRHNTLLHLDNRQPPATNKATISTAAISATIKPAETPVSLAALRQSTIALLSTVCVNATDKWGQQIQCRALLDNGSQTNFITKSLAGRLGLQKSPCAVGVEGIGQTKNRIAERVNVQLSASATSFSKRIEAHIIPKIVSNQPSCSINTGNWNIPKNIQLADPSFHLSRSIDILIGAGSFYSSLCNGHISLGDGLPMLQNTLFGWIVGGEYNNHTNNLTCGICTEDESLSKTMEKFWRLEECETRSRNFTAAERFCENQFIQNTSRHSDGRFIVRLPFQHDPEKLGASKDIALQRFYAIERKLIKNADMKQQYINFMREYEQLGHVEEVSLNNIKGPHFFLPHHAVLKPESTTTKLRVVFDASAKTSTNVSLNDILATGPTIQDDVFTTLIRFRLTRYAFTADIEKMYRQIWMHKDDRKYQLIWWREDQSKPLRCLQLSTVTYGTTSAPYLAIRSLQAIAEEQCQNFPLAANVAKSNFYVDDVLCGSDHLSTALEIQDQLRRMLESAGFKLRKWGANHQRLLESIPKEDQELSTFNSSEKEHIKTMGLIWHPKKDIFTIRVEQVDITQKITKRTALADIARLFDPLGFIAPVTVTAKIFLQELWKLKLDWDAPLQQSLHSTWMKFRHDLQMLTTISIPRHVFSSAPFKDPQIHIFADASEKAYGAVAYVRTTDVHNTICVRFLCAKSRVAPVKQITLPRLELCAAKLAVEVLQKLQESNTFKTIPVFFWSDSTAVLGWIHANSAHYHTFVANRISTIQQVSSPHQWRHVRSGDNPADLISRGLTPDKLTNNNFWFYGPTFLHETVTSWPPEPSVERNCQELRVKIVAATATIPTPCFLDNINHRNSFRCLQRVISYVFRFIKHSQKTPSNRNILVPTVPTADEMENALCHIIRAIQQQNFADERAQLLRKHFVNNSNAISSLKPFIDEKGILRVGGRLNASILSYDAKHQMLLPYRNPITTLLLEDLHKEHLHAGPQTLISIVKQRFWPIKVKILARSVVKNCVQCAKAKPKLFQQLMGNLPEDRVQPSRPFIISGVDFFGPVWTHFKIRGKRPIKSYVAVFCCFATKAVHLELVTDLSTEAFIGALRRFTARRGHCKKLYCDNATNFVGAKNYLEELHNAIHDKKAIERITNECNKGSMEFSFIPPRAPHFGGLWEAAVKSAKHLLQHTLAAASLTYEEMETVVIQAEAIMNSRPITPLTDDPTDLQALTPGHLLIGEPLTSTVDPVAEQNTANNLKRWKLVTQMREDFWKRWSSEYLNSLQHRHKWKQECHNAKPGMMVVIKDDNLPPLKWTLGRIVEVFRGQDGLVRVADVQTATNTLRRPIHKLAPLPIEEEKHCEESTPTVGPPAISESSISKPAETPGHHKRADNKSRRILQKTHRQTSSLVTVLLTCLFLPFCSPTSVEIQQFKTNPGIYFENLGSAEVITSDWTVITYIEMHAYWKEIEIVNGYPNLLNRACEATQSHHQCSATVKLIERLVNAINSNNLLLTTTHTSRAKRGAFNLVGNVARSLFGVLDAEYAEEAALTIERIRQNENHLVSQIRNQTSFLDSTINIMKRNQQDIKESFEKTEKFLNRVSLNIASIQQQLDKERAAQLFNEFALQATLQLLHLQHSQDSLLDILTDTHHGKISPELISPQQLQGELLNIKANLPGHLKLPIPSMELLKFYNLMTIQGRITADYVIFKIKLPLVAIDDYELLKLTAIPWLSNDTFFKIRPASPFLMINLHRDTYYPLSDVEIRECMLAEGDCYLCHLDHPLYKQGSSTSACELSLLHHKPVAGVCEIEAVGTGPHWIQLHDPNTWIFSIAGKLAINAVCGTYLEELHVQHAGLLKLGDHCVIRQERLTIQGHKTLQSTYRRSYVPAINLSELIITSERTPSVDTYSSTYVDQHEELDRLQKQLAALRIELPNQIRPHDIHHYMLGYICLAAAIIIIIVVCRRRVIWHKEHQPPTTDGDAEMQEPELSRITVYHQEG